MAASKTARSGLIPLVPAKYNLTMSGTCRFCKSFIEHDLRSHAANCTSNPNYADRQLRMSISLTKPRITITRQCEEPTCKKEFTITGTQRSLESPRCRRFCSRHCANKHNYDLQRKTEIYERVGQKLRTPLSDPHDDATFRDAVRGTDSWSMLAQVLTFKKAGHVYAHLKRRVKRLNLSTNHFRKPRTPDELLKHRPNESKNNIRGALLKTGRKYECEECGQQPMWNGRPLTLQLDHKDGDRFNHTPENLRFLCPNCHTQTPNYGSKNVATCREKNLPKKIK